MHLAAAFTLALPGVGMTTVALFIPPKGYIHPTVLTAFGELLTFCAAVAGLDYHYGAQTDIKGKEK